MQEVLENLIKRIIESLKKDPDLDKDYLLSGNSVYTKRDIIENLENRTELGIKILNDVCMLAIDLISKGKQVI